MVMQQPKSMASRLTITIIMVALLPTLVIGWAAVSYVFDSIRQSKINDVSHVANFRHDQLSMRLHLAQSRAELILADLPNLCALTSATLTSGQLACLKKTLATFVRTEEALGGELHLGVTVVTVGSTTHLEHTTLPLPHGQLALFPPASDRAARVFHVPVSNERHQMQLVITYPVSVLQNIFVPPAVLGQSGETFLADSQGYFITEPRYHSTQGHGIPISVVPMQTCLRGVNAEMLELDYRAAPIIHGFRFIPEIGGGCIMAHIEQQEAFAPLGRLKWNIVLFALLVTALAGLTAYVLAKQLISPLSRLRKSIEGIQRGNSYGTDLVGDSAPSEISELQTTFEQMMERLALSTQMLQESNQKLHGLFDTTIDAIVSIDEQQNIVMFNHAAEQLFGYQAADMLGQPLELLIPQRLRSSHRIHVDDFDRAGIINRTMNTMPGVAYGLRADGTEFPFEASLSKVVVSGKKIFTAILRDISARKQAESALQLAASVYQQSQEGIIVSDENNLIIDVNPAFTRLTGYTLDEVRGKNPRIFQSGKHEPSFYQAMWQSIMVNGHWQGEIWDEDKRGGQRAHWLNISVLRQPDGSIYRYVGQFSDITEKKRQDELIWKQANYDTLTSLPNRRLLADRIHQAMATSARNECFGGLISLDLDNFKVLNDTAGHPAGDQLLLEVAKRIQACIREEDTVARLGGDEFMVVLNELSSEAQAAALQARHIAEKIRTELNQPYQLGNLEHHNSASFGIVMFYGHRENLDELLAQVDAAMYQAKADGRNAISFFDATMQATLKARTQLESALRQALPQQELQLYYQPQVDRAGRPIGAEALLRWISPSLGMVSPAKFIPIAEESGLILPIGLWVLETACAQLARWQADPELCELSLAVNVSARQFRESDFVAQVRDAIVQSGIRPAGLKLELTESLVLVNVEESIQKMHELKALGIRFSMDDFGTGYSSLSYLSRLPIDQLKIDQSFVRAINTDQHDATIVQTIISMAHSLGLEVIAEGVETEAQREFLDQRGCHAYQGYLFAKPLPIDGIPAMLEQLNKRQAKD